MKTTRTLLPLKVGLSVLVLSFAFWGCEADELDEPRPNVRPETFISELSAGVETRVSWYGTDSDGRIESFEYRWDGGTWVETTELSEIFPTESGAVYDDFKFVDLDEEKVFEVRATDNAGGTDQSPATATASAVTVSPETQILEGPSTGEVVGTDVRFVWDGVDPDGSIVGYEWTLDDPTAWNEVSDAITEHTFYLLGAGSHVFFVRAIDDLGAVDGTPAQSAFVVATGFVPKIENTSSLSDGGAWFSGLPVDFSWAANVTYYKGVLPDGAYSYSFNDGANFDLTSTPLASGWGSTASYSVAGDDLVPGSHTFYMKARDVSGNVDTMRIGFVAAAFAPTKDMLLLDNFNWTPCDYASHDAIATAISTGFLNGVTYDTEDLDVNGTGFLTPGNLGQYKSVVMYTDGGYNGSDFGGLFAAYATAGGNLMITGYYLANFGSSILTPFGLYPSVFGSGAFTSTELTGDLDGMIKTDDLVMPLPAGCATRPTERVYSDADNTEEGVFVNHYGGDGRSVGAIASMNDGGNYVLIIGQSIAFWDQTDADVAEFGNRVSALFGIADTDNP